MMTHRPKTHARPVRGTAARLLATVGALLLATGLVVLGAASASADKGGEGKPGAPGNNGTVKVGDSTDLDEGRPENDPHLPCTFNIQWFNFDSGWGTLDATVEIELQAPTHEAKGVDMSVASGDLSPSFVGNGGQPGAGGGMDHLEWYTLDFTGDPQPQQGYHVKITVTTPHSFGSDRKFKVFWVGPCEAPESSAPPSSAPPTSEPPSSAAPPSSSAPSPVAPSESVLGTETVKPKPTKKPTQAPPAAEETVLGTQAVAPTAVAAGSAGDQGPGGPGAGGWAALLVAAGLALLAAGGALGLRGPHGSHQA